MPFSYCASLVAHPSEQIGVKVMKRVRVALVGLAAGLLFFVGIGNAPAASAAVRGVSVADYCYALYAGSSPKAVLVAPNVTGWRCRLNWWFYSRDVGVDMNQACRMQYGTSAYYVTWSNPFSWRCR